MKQTFFNDPAIDRLVNVALALAAEVQLLRDRQRAMESLLRRQGVVAPEHIESWEPDDAEHAAAEAERDLFVRNVLGPLAEDLR
jgi:hypothetical protein